jgi:hypothetical protein
MRKRSTKTKTKYLQCPLISPNQPEMKNPRSLLKTLLENRYPYLLPSLLPYLYYPRKARKKRLIVPTRLMRKTVEEEGGPNGENTDPSLSLPIDRPRCVRDTPNCFTSYSFLRTLICMYPPSGSGFSVLATSLLALRYLGKFKMPSRQSSSTDLGTSAALNWPPTPTHDRHLHYPPRSLPL